MKHALPTLVVVGNGMVGHKFLELLSESCLIDRYRVVVFGEEPELAYDRVALSSFFSGTQPEELALGRADTYAAWGAEIRRSEAVVAIDTEAKRVTSNKGEHLDYDVLVLATGSAPFVPRVEGAEGPGCFTYRTLADVERLRAFARDCDRGVVIGGGLLGLEAAKALASMGLETHVVEFASRLMPIQLDPPGAEVLRDKIEALGVGVHTNKATTRIVHTGNRVERLEFADGGVLAADLVVFSAGIRPRDELARGAGLATAPRGGVSIDAQCRTSAADVYAIGECASWDGRVFGLVAPGYAMARVVAAQLGGGEARFEGAELSTKLKLLGVDVASFGDAFADTPGARSIVLRDDVSGVYKKLVLTRDGVRLLGGILVGETSDYGVLSSLAQAGADLPPNPESLILSARVGSVDAPIGAAALPDTANVCSCNTVSKGQLCRAIAGGCHDLASLKAATKVGTGCGGCLPLVKELLDGELARAGVATTRALCEHFDHTRQELFHFVRIEGLRSFSELLAKHGRGRGCEICKPTVASILASVSSEHVLEGERATLQDTNDAYLANIQRDGTYSVVPRVPGGEITPEQLRVIAEVAKDFGLYTKLTGGQRIDLFGARLDQLPRIWRRLVDAGFESGHAYGKALRTVKSCVGNSWCRYGVQDSVALAIRLELRYRGIRAPHKLKSAVSGCARECAEAQSKDFGVIATEQGWNLYVGGNGGTRPRHADLLATNLDTETLVRVIDRFIVFYIRTADRLQRTATWLEHLEGGVGTLRDVVVEDKLGLAAELEAEMERLVEGYRCEWKSALENPQTLARFRHFVNSSAPDDGLLFVEERGQRRPAREAERAAETPGRRARRLALVEEPRR